MTTHGRNVPRPGRQAGGKPRTGPATDPDLPGQTLLGHNGGPPLEEPHRPEWGNGPVGSYFVWKAARAASRKVTRAEMMLRLRNADRLGLTYDEYTLELLERGRYLHAEDADRVEAIKAARRPPRP